MPTSGEVLRGLSNVQQFVELATEHQQGLVRDGIVWTEPVPVWLRPYTSVRRGYPENRVVRWDYMLGVDKALVVDENDRAPKGKRDIYGVEALEPLHFAGHTMDVTPKELRRWAAQDTVAEMIRQPAEEWMRTAQEAMMDVATAGAFSSATNIPTDDFAPSIKDFNGVTHTQRKATNSSNTASATIANSSHQVTFANRSGGTFAAGHDHVNPATGGGWTRARGRTQRDLILEHPNVLSASAYVGSTVADAVLTETETQHGVVTTGAATSPHAPQALQNLRVGYEASDFGVPTFIGTVDNVAYFHVQDIPADTQVTIANGARPFEVFIGARREDGGIDPPFGWTERMHRELRGANDDAGVEYGYKGHWGGHCRMPTMVAVAKHVA